MSVGGRGLYMRGGGVYVGECFGGRQGPVHERGEGYTLVSVWGEAKKTFVVN